MDTIKRLVIFQDLKFERIACKPSMFATPFSCGSYHQLLWFGSLDKMLLSFVCCIYPPNIAHAANVVCVLYASSIKISFQAHSSVNPLVLYLSVHFHTFRLLSFRLFIRPSIGASVPAFFRPSVFRCVSSYVSMYNLSFNPPSVHSMFGSSGVHSLACPFALRLTIRSFFRPYFHSRLTG